MGSDTTLAEELAREAKGHVHVVEKDHGIGPAPVASPPGVHLMPGCCCLSWHVLCLVTLFQWPPFCSSSFVHTPLPSRLPLTVCSAGRVFVAGGYDGTRALPHCFCWDAETDAWLAHPPLASPRYHLALVALGGALYALGGFDGRFHPPSPSTLASSRYRKEIRQ